MAKNDSLIRWGAICSITAGLIFLVPLIFYFYLLPMAGSSATHAQDPSSFLPWMAVEGRVRIALWWTVIIVFLIILFGVPFALSKKLQKVSPTFAKVAELSGILGSFTIIISSMLLAGGEMPLAEVQCRPEGRWRMRGDDL